DRQTGDHQDGALITHVTVENAVLDRRIHIHRSVSCTLDDDDSVGSCIPDCVEVRLRKLLGDHLELVPAAAGRAAQSTGRTVLLHLYKNNVAKSQGSRRPVDGIRKIRRVPAKNPPAILADYG